MSQGGKFNRERSAGSPSQLLPAMGHKAAPVGSSAAFFKATGPGGRDLGLLLALISPFPASSPGPTPISVAAL